jgi:hypothetical protein
MAESTPQKRRYPRLPLKNLMLVQKVAAPAEEALAKTRSLGAGGCMFVSQAAFGEGTLLDLFLSIEGQAIQTKAQVVYELPQPDGTIHIGVEFRDIPVLDRALLERFLEEKELAPEG